MKLTKANVKKVADFLQSAVNTITTTDYTCSKFDLDEDLGLFVGWLPGYSPEDADTDYIDCAATEENPVYWGVNAGIKIKATLWCDFEYLNSPWFVNDGYVVDNDCTISKNEDYTRLARYYIKEYNAIRKGIKNKTITIA